jgi:hypothetical protein
VDKDFDQMIQDQMHCYEDTDTHVFLTKGEHDQYMGRNDDIMLETDDTLSWETKEFRKGYHNSIMQFQKKYNLRRRKASAEPQQMNPIREPQATSLSRADQRKTTRTRMQLKREIQRRRF